MQTNAVCRPFFHTDILVPYSKTDVYSYRNVFIVWFCLGQQTVDYCCTNHIQNTNYKKELSATLFSTSLMDQQRLIEDYKRNNSELALNLAEKREELRMVNAEIIQQNRELQRLQEETIFLKQELAIREDKMKRWRAAMIEMITANTTQYTKLMTMTGCQFPGSGSNAATVAAINGNQSIAERPRQRTLPAITVTQKESPPPPLPSPPQEDHFNVNAVARRRQTQELITRDKSPRNRTPDPMRLTNITEEGSILEDSVGDDILLAVPSHIRNRQNQITEIRSVPKTPENRLQKRKPSPLASTENILRSPNESPEAKKSKLKTVVAEKNVSQRKKVPKLNIEKLQIVKTADPNNIEGKETARPKRRAAPSQLIEPKVNTKLRRD